MADERPSGLEAAQEVHDGVPECSCCEHPLGTNSGCMECLYAYESHLRTLGYDVPGAP